nr:hypothetical protein [Tanacetum cinerariifolium]
MNRMNESDEAWAQTAVALLELTSLNADDTAERIVALCEKAKTPVGNVAAVCVLPRFAGLARRTLDNAQAREIKVVAAVNFPNGGGSVSAVASETQAAVLAGVDEIDLVYPFHAHLGGDKQAARILIEAIAELGAQVGFKASGNVRTVSEARTYLEMAQARFGPYWLEAHRMRLGGSSLLDDLLTQLGMGT